jgi:uroporphyrinogen-III synthase
MNNLHHLHILVTRPSLPGEALCKLIINHGGQVTHFPTIAFAPPPDIHAFQHALTLLGEQDWLIFISPQAVYASVTLIRKLWPHFPDPVKWAAVGAGTAKALNEAGYNVTIHPEKNWNSERILELPEFQSVSGKKIAIIRGVGGREILDKCLVGRGASLLPVIAYERVMPKVDTSSCFALLKQGIIDIIVCASFESVKNLKTLLGEVGWPYLKDIPVVVVSERIKSLAQDLGFRKIGVAHDASQTAMLEIMAQKGSGSR